MSKDKPNGGSKPPPYVVLIMSKDKQKGGSKPPPYVVLIFFSAFIASFAFV